MVRRSAVIAAATALSLIMGGEAAAQQVWKNTTELGTPAALRLELEYQEPSDLFSRLEGTLVFPLLVTARNISTQPLTLLVKDLQLDLGNEAGPVRRLVPIDAKVAIDMIERDVEMSKALRFIIGQGSNLARNPYRWRLTDEQLDPNESKQGYVFFLRPAGFRFDGFMAISTTRHKPEIGEPVSPRPSWRPSAGWRTTPGTGGRSARVTRCCSGCPSTPRLTRYQAPPRTWRA